MSGHIYRYKFCEDFANELYDFAKIHEHDNRHDFKEAWTEWTEENEDIIQEEIERLQELGYDGNALDKMFKSARYYFRKKSTVKKAPAERTGHISLDKDIIETMDRHISSNLDIKPAASYETFLLECQENVQRTVLFLKTQHDLEDSMERIKKAYKNRYFILGKSPK
jgi:endo-alpha-1,4-polygalactosaminidase (GH114 family)